MKKLRIVSFVSLWLVVALSFTCFSYSAGTVDVNLSIRAVFLSSCVLILEIYVLITFYKNKLVPVLSSEMKIFLLLFSGYFLFAIPGWIIYRLNFPLGLFDLTKIIISGSLIAFLFLLRRKDDDYPETLAKLMTVLGTGASLIGLYQIFMVHGFSNLDHQTAYQVSSAFGHKNIFAEILLLCFPFSFFLLSKKNTVWKMIGAGNLIVCFFFLITLLSRSAWVAFALASVCCGLVYVRNEKTNFTLIISWKNLSFLIFLIAISFLFITLSNASHSITQQVKSFFYVPFGSAGDRILLWKNTLHLFAMHPLSGCGIGSWNIQILQFGRSGFWKEDTVTFYQHPHNDYLEILSEQGVFSFLFYCSAIFFVLNRLFILVKREPHVLNYCFLFAFIAYLVFSFFSFPKSRIEHVLIFSLLVVVAFPATQQTGKTASKFIYFILALMIIVLSSVFLYAMFRLKNEKILGQAFTSRADMNWKKMKSELNQIDTNFFSIDPLSTPIVWYEGIADFNSGDYESAMKHFEESNRLNPWHVHGLNNLGTCYELKGMHDSAQLYFNKAIALQPTFEEALLNLSAVYFNTGKQEDAMNGFQKILNPVDTVKYSMFRNLIIPTYVNYLRDKETTSEIKNKLTEIAENPQWEYDLFEKAKKNKVPFKEQIMSDILYLFVHFEKSNYLYTKFENYKL